ncbi:hypothetical protein FGG08_007017 [Glutinoglossum americanum]|uniref:Essential protein Yae1 N-terminal domain-containing protein n=1 Tax=Glutinoglossum americanum TaxID=1670608 RepID=A0A9P8L0F9_9PEZI|nr:hypothetical protein FGG08_007017 [Glutinoglossum americanum]
MQDDSGQVIPGQEDGDEDPFFSVLNLEDKFYREGHAEGVSDGARAGLLEGHIFGLEKGFEKYLAMGRLHGRAVVWAGRLQKCQKPPSTTASNLKQIPKTPQDPPPPSHSPTATTSPQISLTRQPSPLPPNPRLEKHILHLHALTDPTTLSNQNTEDSVSDFDDRLKRALAKAKVIGRIIGEDSGGGGGGGKGGNRGTNGGGEGSIEDVGG